LLDVLRRAQTRIRSASPSQRVSDFRSVGVVLHARRVLRAVRQHGPVCRDDGHSQVGILDHPLGHDVGMGGVALEREAASVGDPQEFLFLLGNDRVGEGAEKTPSPRAREYEQDEDVADDQASAEPGERACRERAHCGSPPAAEGSNRYPTPWTVWI
jgi:hypothetical protein